tara:strand:+ start:812 stop:1684 length:873 start_codon:yes stop_codon:yes gene_type:complete
MGFIINGDRVEDNVIDDEFESIKEHYESIGETVCCDRDVEIRELAQDNVINRTLLEQESIGQFGEIPDSELDDKFSQLIKEHGSEGEFYENTGFNPGDTSTIRAKLKSSLLIDRLLESKLANQGDPTDEDLESYYQENIERYMTEEQVRVSQIFIEPSSHDAAREAYVALRRLRRELLDGKDFDEAAREHGSDEDRDIDLGFTKQGETMPEVEAITFSMEINEISPVVATHYGFHVFKLTDRKKPEPIPRSEIEGLKERLIGDKKTVAIDSYIEDLRNKATIEKAEGETA